MISIGFSVNIIFIINLLVLDVEVDVETIKKFRIQILK